MSRIVAFSKKLFGLDKVTPQAADMQAQIAAANARADQAQLHAMDATRRLADSMPVPAAIAAAVVPVPAAKPAAEVAPAPAPTAATITPAGPATGSTVAVDAAAQTTPTTPTKGKDVSTLEPLTGQNLIDMLYLRATGSSSPNVPAYVRLTSALGGSYRTYVNAYGGGGQFFVPAEHTGQFISDWSHGWTIIGIGGMTPEQFASVKPDLIAAGFTNVA